MSIAHVEACEQSERLERTSDLNLITFFDRELREIGEGQKATSILNDSIIKNLIRLGILEHATLRGRGVRVLILTNKGRCLLESQ